MDDPIIKLHGLDTSIKLMHIIFMHDFSCNLYSNIPNRTECVQINFTLNFSGGIWEKQRVCYIQPHGINKINCNHKLQQKELNIP
jgi:hypothetical protein